MTVYNLGSINADLVYRVARLPVAGETLASSDCSRGLGGKGANMSVAAARAGSHVVHIGAVGPDGGWAVERLLEYGVDTRHVARTAAATGHAIIAVDDAGENLIILFAGANKALQAEAIAVALGDARPGDWFLLQNETNAQRAGAERASALGMRVVYAAAPFDVAAIMAVLPLLDMLVLNAVEAAQLESATGQDISLLPVRDIVVTLGADGSRWINTDTGAVHHFPAVAVEPVDTTGAGDTFTGYLLAGLDRGMPMAQAITQATRAAAIMVTRRGAADVIPDLKELQDSRIQSVLRPVKSR